MNNNERIGREQQNELPTLTRQFRTNNLEYQPIAEQVPETFVYARAIGEEGIPNNATPTIASSLPPLVGVNRIEPESNIPIAVAEEIPKYIRRAYRELLNNNRSSINGIIRGADGAATYNLLAGGRVEVITERGYADTSRGIRNTTNQSKIYIVDVDAYNQWRQRPRTPEAPMRSGFFNRFIRR
jgi:hypothetical protein